MNDRFAAQLRQHLLLTANDRPAEGQLAAVVEVVAGTAQSHPLAARLRWNPGRTGPFPLVQLRYALVVLALVAAALATALIIAGGPTRSTVFEGTWTSIDPGDGSTQYLVVAAGTSPAVRYVDNFATGLACRADTAKVFTADGRGMVIAADRLEVQWPDGGGCGLETVGIAIGYLDYNEATDTLLDSQKLSWSRVVGGDVPPTPAPVTSPGPSSASEPPPQSPRPGEATFTSPTYGISIDYPAGWQTRPATVPWLGEPLSFDSPAADVIFDPALGDRLYLLLASQPNQKPAADEFRRRVLAWTCPGDGGFEMWSWHVDGASSWQQGPCNSGSIVTTDTRGYIIRLVVSNDEPGLADTYDWEWLVQVLETVDLRPEQAPEIPECIEYRDGGTYTQAVDPLQVTATLPRGTESGWWTGNPYVFATGSDTCLFDPAIQLDVSGVFQLYGSACRWDGAAVDLRSREGGIATLTQNGLDATAPTDATLGGHPASWFEISAPVDLELTTCDGAQMRLWDSGPGLDATIDPGETVRVYLVDVDGLILGVTATWSAGDERLPAKMAELEAVLASMRIEPQVPH